MVTAVAAVGTSDDYRSALSHPLAGTVKPAFLPRVFRALPDVERLNICKQNEWAALGRQIAAYISDLIDETTKKRAYDAYGTYVNAIGHALNAAILTSQGVECKEYVKSVNESIVAIFEKIQKFPNQPLKFMICSYELNQIDIPQGKSGEEIVLEGVRTHPLRVQFEKLFKELKFFTEIFTRNGTSLRAVANKQAAEQLIDLVKKMIEESGLLEKSDKSDWFEEASCNMIEAKEVDEWVREKAEKHEFNDENITRLQNRTLEGFRVAAHEIVLKAVLARMEEFKKENPTIPFSPKEVVMFLIQDFYPRILGAKVNVDADCINKARQFVLPE